MTESIAFIWRDQHLRQKLQCVECCISGTRASCPTLCDLLPNIAVVPRRNRPAEEPARTCKYLAIDNVNVRSHVRKMMQHSSGLEDVLVVDGPGYQRAR